MPNPNRNDSLSIKSTTFTGLFISGWPEEKWEEGRKGVYGQLKKLPKEGMVIVLSAKFAKSQSWVSLVQFLFNLA